MNIKLVTCERVSAECLSHRISANVSSSAFILYLIVKRIENTDNQALIEQQNHNNNDFEN